MPAWLKFKMDQGNFKKETFLPQNLSLAKPVKKRGFFSI
jgi:hypothetical protein